MSYKIKFDDITSVQVESQKTMNAWEEAIANLNKAMSDFINNQNLQGQAISSMRRYLVEVHGTLLQTLVNLMNDYSTNLLLYKDGYYQIDGDLHTKLPSKVFTNLHSALKSSRDDLKSEIEVLNTTKDKISDLVSYEGSSHTSTVMNYNFLMNQLKNLDTSITQYESNHASQDLVAFKELLAATKALVAEHAGKTRTVGTYQSGDFAKLKSVQRFAIAYKQATQQMESRVERVQAAQERDKVRFEALARSDKGWKDMAVSALTIIVGVTAIVVTLGSATPLVVAGGIVGLGTTAYGASNMYEADQDIKLGNAGDIQTKAGNPIRDTLFMGNDKLYHDVGNIFVTASAIMIPIGQTQSVVKGLTQFAIGEAGAYTAGQVAYHGTKLLGGSEEDAQTANFIGNLVGGYAVSSATSKFSLNKVKDAFSTNTKKYTLNSDRLSNLELYTSPEIKAKINKAGYSLEDFSNLVDADTTLSAKTDAFVKAVRKEIGIPAPKTKMNKTIPTEFVESYLSGERNSFAGFVSVDEHSKSLTTLPEIVEGNRLDYPNTPFDLEKTKTYAKISFFLDEADKLDIPFGELDNASYPFTGRGFTGSKNIILPEYKLMEERNFMDGDLITIFESKSGNPIRQYKYIENKGWKLIK
ncbi:T7SS effector LXG polymorphic toxin [Streptococcus mitis]